MDNQTYQPFTPQSAGGQPQPGAQNMNQGMGPGANPGMMQQQMGPQPLAGMGPMPTSTLPATKKQQKDQKLFDNSAYRPR